jgi:REP element-mobilizing transposase RayT
MDNHIHLIWQMMAGIKPEAVQRDFMKYTAQKIKQDLIKNHPAVLTHFKVDAKDRKYLPRAIGMGKKCIKCGIEYFRDVKTKVGLHSL